MTRWIGIALAVTMITGCSQSTEQICKETDQLLKEHGMEGFTESGYRGCLGLSAKQAAQSLHSLREQLNASKVKSRSRAEVDEIMQSASLAKLLSEFGEPDVADYFNNAKSLQSKNLSNSVDDDISLNKMYSKDATDRESRDRAILLSVLTNYNQGINGTYSFSWSKITSDMFGMEDDHVQLMVIIIDGKIVTRDVGFPKYFWQRWLDRF